jgi:peptidoglycan/xylan/chitin deacetylase (PgdA/CDA1 family)
LKYIIKTLFLPLLASRPVTAIATRWLGHGVPVFMLHRMQTEAFPNRGGIGVDHLRRTLRYLVDNGYEFLSLEHLLNALASHTPLPPRAAVFTLDDGYLDQAEVAAPVFIEFNCPVTFFVITGMLDGALWPWDAKVSWIVQTTERTALEAEINGQPVVLDFGTAASRRKAKHRLQDLLREVPAADVPAIIEQFARDAGVVVPAQPPEKFRPMSWNMARQLEARGIQFAPHSVTHATLSRLSAESLESEIRDSWQALERELEHPVRIFCYPTGRASDFGPREFAALERHGFLGAVSATPAFVDATDGAGQQRFSLPRLSLPERMADFIQCCSWIGYSRLNHGRRTDGDRRQNHDRSRIARGTI